MRYKADLARKAIIKALQVRKDNGIELHEAVCVYDLAEKMKVKVRFDDLPSVEGIYVNDLPPRIMLSSLRPAGRMAFTCAHELGHHCFNHGTTHDDLRDEQMEKNFVPEEYIADCFACFLLMPKMAVSHAFYKRGWDAANCSARQLYTVSNWLGVGYTSLAKHMSYSLALLPQELMHELCKVSPKKLKGNILGEEFTGDLIIVDEKWTGRPVDMQVGDMILAIDQAQFENTAIEPFSIGGKNTFKAVRPGISRLYGNSGQWAAFVRVARKEYNGQCQYRHLEDSEHE